MSRSSCRSPGSTASTSCRAAPVASCPVTLACLASGAQLEDDEDSAERFERHAQALAAGLGAVAGLPFGPAGAIVGAALGPLLVPVAEEIFREVGMDGRRRSGEALAATCEASGLSAKETTRRALSNEKSRLLSATAIVAATHTAWEDKVRTLGRSLASGLLAADDAEVDSEQLIMAAIADMEAPHLALLDLLVDWQPPWVGGAANPTRLGIREDSQSQPAEHSWNVGQRKWYVHVIQTYRPRLTPVFAGLVGTLQRHGLAIYESNVDNSFSLRLQSYDPEMKRPYMEPTELGQRVWLRFCRAGANVPDVWTASASSPNA
jgi:hypothetical protein